MLNQLIDKIRKTNKKIVVGGEGGVGRTTLLYRYTDGYFSSDTKMTRGVQFFTKSIDIDNKTINFIFWDLAGQERWRFFQSDLCKGADGAILAFDLTRDNTLYNIEQWVNILRSWDINLPILFVGMKLDLTNDILIDDEYALTFKEQYNLSGYFKISCKTGEGVHEAFGTLFDLVMKRKWYENWYEKERKRNETTLKKRFSEVEQLIQEQNLSKAEIELIDITSIAKQYNLNEIIRWTLQKRYPIIEQLIENEKYLEAEQRLEKIKNNFVKTKIPEWVKQKLDFCYNQKEKRLKKEEINTIKKTILDLGTKFGRLQIMEISEVCSIEGEDLIIDTVKEMINNKEIYAQYFSSTKSIAFDQQANIVEIDKLMATYKEWEDKKVGKK